MTEQAKVLAGLAGFIALPAEQGPLAARLCEACRSLLGADGAAIMVETSRLDHLPLTATDALSARLESLQEVVGEGPGRDAFRTGRMVALRLPGPDEHRWPLFSDGAAGLGELSLWALPMAPGGSVLGVVTVLRRDRNSLSEDLATAQFLSNAVGAALLRDPLIHADYSVGGLWSARAEVHQAMGMVTAQLGIDGEDALALLSAHAFAHSLDLSEVAAQVTGRSLDFRSVD